MTAWADVVLGIDAGNTKTVALVTDLRGQVLGWGRAGPANIYTSVPRALAALTHAVEQARSVAGLSDRPARATVLSASGADWPEDFALLHTSLAQRGWAERTVVVNDAVGALRAGSVDGLGVAVVCGTSSGTAARAPDGRVWHTSFWQEPEGAEHLAELALRAVYRAHLGIDPPTSLTGRVLAHFGLDTPEALLHRLTARGAARPRLGHLARVLLDEAQAGDPTSCLIVRQHGEALGDYALAAARRINLSGNYRVVTSGGVMRHPSPLLREALVARVQASAPQVTWQASPLEPVCGAALLAVEAAGGHVDDTSFQALGDSRLQPELFAT